MESRRAVKAKSAGLGGHGREMLQHSEGLKQLTKKCTSACENWSAIHLQFSTHKRKRSSSPNYSPPSVDKKGDCVGGSCAGGTWQIPRCSLLPHKPKMLVEWPQRAEELFEPRPLHEPHVSQAGQSGALPLTVISAASAIETTCQKTLKSRLELLQHSLSTSLVNSDVDLDTSS